MVCGLNEKFAAISILHAQSADSWETHQLVVKMSSLPLVRVSLQGGRDPAETMGTSGRDVPGADHSTHNTSVRRTLSRRTFEQRIPLDVGETSSN